MSADGKGLTSQEAKEKLSIEGRNILPEKPPPSGFSILISQFKSPLVYVLVFAGIVTLLLREIADTVDCVVMGYTVGRGKRAGFGVGQFLVGVISKSDSKSKWGNKILTLTKIGTGLTDEQFRELKTRLTKLEVKEKPREYEAHKNYTPDYWVEPKLVVELAGDDLTKSPTHTSGYALRFPRLVNFRDDKSVAEATTLQEIKTLFGMQGR